MTTTRAIQIHLVRCVAQDSAASRATLHALLVKYRKKSKVQYEWLKNLLKTEREYVKMYDTLRKLHRRGSFRERVTTLRALRIPHNHHSDETSPMRVHLCRLVEDMAREVNAELCAVRSMSGL